MKPVTDRKLDTGVTDMGLARVSGVLAAALLMAAPALAQQAGSAAAPAAAAPAAPNCAADQSLPSAALRPQLWRGDWLDAQRAAVQADRALATRWRDAANAAISRPIRTVVDKRMLPASGSAHDYHSLAPYWWPNADSPDGLPYQRRDGRINPARSGPEFDHSALQQLRSDVRLLALAHHHLDDERYGMRAAELVRAWFINPATRMNPNFAYAQAVPGVSTGRPEGVIDALALADVAEAIGLLSRASMLSDAEQQAVRTWFVQLSDWLRTSENGIAESRAGNNHSLYYDYLLSHFALFAGQQQVAAEVISAFPARRLSVQMQPDGSLPRELDRTRPFHYSLFALEAGVRLALLAPCAGVSGWPMAGAAGQSLERGLGWLAPYAAAPDSWTREDIDFAEPARRARALADAARLFRLASWAGAAPGPAASANALPEPVGDLSIPDRNGAPVTISNN